MLAVGGADPGRERRLNEPLPGEDSLVTFVEETRGGLNRLL